VLRHLKVLYVLLALASASLSLLLGFVVYPKTFNYFAPSFVIQFAYAPIILAAAFFALRGALPVALLVALVVGVLSVQGSKVVVNSFWWQTSSLYLLFGVMAGSMAELVKKPSRQDDAVIPSEHVSTLNGKVLEDLVASLKQRDGATQSHSERVAQNAFVVGRELQLSPASLETLYWSALLHDVGKLSVPEPILLKAGKLTDAEYSEVKRHPEHGAALLTSMSAEFAAIAEVVKSHHERWDGTGYPNGLSGQAIPQLSRIIAVVDAFEALTSVRPYREPMPTKTALAYLEQESERHFDPKIVRTFVECFQRGEIRYAGLETVAKKVEAITEVEREKLSKN
jgi:HD-GYP domain-containing protein (c-di-GMP phosphodiesterase class II)